MPAGEAFSPRQRADIERMIGIAHKQSGVPFSVYVGPLEHGRDSATELLGQLPGAASVVFVAVDPARRLLEIVTGSDAHELLDDQSCRLAAMSMTSSFQAGDLVGGLRDGLVVLADHARQPRVLHLDTP